MSTLKRIPPSNTVYQIKNSFKMVILNDERINSPCRQEPKWFKTLFHQNYRGSNIFKVMCHLLPPFFLISLRLSLPTKNTLLMRFKG